MICGQPIDRALKRPHPMALHVDHTVARSQDGGDNVAQLRATHAGCNLRKGADAA
jgi:5-methylcytosine-specific restriction endonuclease McrA